MSNIKSTDLTYGSMIPYLYLRYSITPYKPIHPTLTTNIILTIISNRISQTYSCPLSAPSPFLYFPPSPPQKALPHPLRFSSFSPPPSSASFSKEIGSIREWGTVTISIYLGQFCRVRLASKLNRFVLYSASSSFRNLSLGVCGPIKQTSEVRFCFRFIAFISALYIYLSTPAQKLQ